MKKLFYSALAIVALAACTKEMQTPDQAVVKGRLVSISASLDDATKTSYANEKTFSWTKDDAIAVQVIKDEDGSYDQVTFTASESGAVVNFTGTIPEGYSIGSLAFYPKGTSRGDNLTYNKNNPATVSLAGTIRPDLSNPLSSVPLIGQKKETADEGETYSFSFSTATGIVKATVNNIPAEARYVIFYNATTALNGTFTLGEDNRFTMEDAATAYGEKYINFTPEADGENRSFYFPIPEGTIPAGTMFAVLNTSFNIIIEQEIKKDITVKRNTIIDLAPLTLPDSWTSLGTGLYKDTYLIGTAFYQTEVQQCNYDEKRFRLLNPYGTIWSKIGYNVSSEAVGPDAFLTFYIGEPDEEIGPSKVKLTRDDLVFWDAYNTGYYYSNGEFVLRNVGLHYSGVTENYLTASRVLAWQDNGIPANIQLAPVYYHPTATSWQYGTNNRIQIVFPGCDALVFTLSAEHRGNEGGKANFRIALPNGADKAVLGIGATLDDAKAQITGGTGLTLTASGDVALDLPSTDAGMYYMAWSTYRDDAVFESGDVSFVVAAETPSEDYNKWIGTWTVVDEAKSYTWEITAAANDVSYTVTGLWGYDFIKAEALFNKADGTLSIYTQPIYAAGYYLWAVLSTNSINHASGVCVMTATLDETLNQATLAGGSYNGTPITGYYFSEGNTNHGWGRLPATLTRVVDEPDPLPEIEIDGDFSDWDTYAESVVTKTYDGVLSQVRAYSDGTTLWVDMQYAHATKALTLSDWNVYITLYFDTVEGQGGTEWYASGSDFRMQFRPYQTGNWASSISLLQQQKYEGGWTNTSAYTNSDFEIACGQIEDGKYEFEFSMPVAGLGVTSGSSVKLNFLGYSPEYHSGNSPLVIPIP